MTTCLWGQCSWRMCVWGQCVCSVYEDSVCLQCVWGRLYANTLHIRNNDTRSADPVRLVLMRNRTDVSWAHRNLFITGHTQKTKAVGGQSVYLSLFTSGLINRRYRTGTSPSVNSGRLRNTMCRVDQWLKGSHRFKSWFWQHATAQVQWSHSLICTRKISYSRWDWRTKSGNK